MVAECRSGGCTRGGAIMRILLWKGWKGFTEVERGGKESEGDKCMSWVFFYLYIINVLVK